MPVVKQTNKQMKRQTKNSSDKLITERFFCSVVCVSLKCLAVLKGGETKRLPFG